MILPSVSDTRTLFICSDVAHSHATILAANLASTYVRVEAKLQALVYGILPSTTAVFSYAVGSRKLSANEQFFVGAQTVVILVVVVVANNSNKTRRVIYSRQQSLHQHK